MSIIFPYLQSFWALFNDYAYMRAALIAAAGYLIAKLLSHYIPLGVTKVATHLKLNLGDEVAALIRFPLFYLTFFISLLFATHAANLSEPVEFAFTAIFRSLIVIIIAISIYRFILWMLVRAAANKNRIHLIQTQTLPLFTNTALIFVAFAAIHQVFAAWHVDMTALLASAGIAGMAIGMAAKDLISDVLAGVMIMTDNPYQVGDVVLVDDVIADTSTRGEVSHIGLRSTRILTKDNIQVVVPNSKMSNDSVINESSSTEVGIRLKLTVRTAYGIDPERVRALLFAACEGNTNIIPEAKKKVILADFTERFATYKLIIWISDPMQRSPTLSALREAVYVSFIREDISIALPNDGTIEITKQALAQQEIVIKEMPDNKRELYIKEVPNLFGHGDTKSIGNTKVKPISKPIKYRTAKEAMTHDH